MGTLVMIAQTQGWKQLFSGLSINYVKVNINILLIFAPLNSISLSKFANVHLYEFQVVPSVAIGFTVYDVMKAFLQVPPRDESFVEVASNRRNNQPTSRTSSPPLSQTQP